MMGAAFHFGGYDDQTIKSSVVGKMMSDGASFKPSVRGAGQKTSFNQDQFMDDFGGDDGNYPGNNFQPNYASHD
jgi:hypothetical protein